MKLVQLVPKEKILDTAIQLVRRAEKEIVVTMNLDEEILEPLPRKYHDALIHKVDHGKKVIRYGFGSADSFRKLRKIHRKITFIYAGKLKFYLRMIIIDRRLGMFELGGVKYLTRYPPLAETLVKYIESVYNRGKL